MKKTIKYILMLILGIILGAGIACGVYFLTIGEVAWNEYVETKLIPNIMVILSSVGTIIIAIQPILKNVSGAAEKFTTATNEINTTVANEGKTKEKIASLEERLEKIESASTNAEQIARIGFGNLDELVIKGYAKEIAKVGQTDEQTKE